MGMLSLCVSLLESKRCCAAVYCMPSLSQLAAAGLTCVALHSGVLAGTSDDTIRAAMALFEAYVSSEHDLPIAQLAGEDVIPDAEETRRESVDEETRHRCRKEDVGRNDEVCEEPERGT